jgi:hypothetical protein
MSRDGAIIFGDLIGKLDVLYVHCPKCSRAGRYRVQHLIDERGRDGKVIDWLDQITTDCPQKMTHSKTTGPLLFFITGAVRAPSLQALLE